MFSSDLSKEEEESDPEPSMDLTDAKQQIHMILNAGDSGSSVSQEPYGEDILPQAGPPEGAIPKLHLPV